MEWNEGLVGLHMKCVFTISEFTSLGSCRLFRVSKAPGHQSIRKSGEKDMIIMLTVTHPSIHASI